jgi:RNA polymerase sigma-70 factor (ECF subfamily)
MEDDHVRNGTEHDNALVDASRQGDRAALDALLRRHQPKLYAICVRMTGNTADADDAMQEALIAIARGLRSFDGRSAFSTWAYRVTTNACLDELRRRRRRPDVGLPPSSVIEATTQAPDASDAVAARADLGSALASLAPEFRAALVLREIGDLSYQQIADALGVPVGTVRSRIARGRAALLGLLVDAGDAGNGGNTGNAPTPSDRPTPDRP